LQKAIDMKLRKSYVVCIQCRSKLARLSCVLTISDREWAIDTKLCKSYFLWD